MSEGIVIGNAAELDRKALPPLATESLNILPKEGSSEVLVRNRSSGSLLHLVSEPEPSPCADPTLNPVASLSIGTQTERPDPDAPKFTVGSQEGEGETTSKQHHPSLDLPPVPRQVEECVAILKSDVSDYH